MVEENTAAKDQALAVGVDATAEQRTVFVSYSRRDAEFVLEMQALLQDLGLEVWLDRDDIPPSTNWRDEIQDGIERAEAFIIVVSPDSAASAEVGKEVDRAVNLGKRLIPVVCRDVDPVLTQPAVSERNWIFWKSPDDRHNAVDLIDTSLRIDPEWTKEHTRLNGRALVWEKKGRVKSLVLRGRDLKAAEAAIAIDRPVDQPQVSALMREYISASRTAAVRRQRIMVAVASIVAIVSISLAAAALVQRAEADRQRKEAVVQRDTATSTALASQAENNIQVEPDLAALLALESFRIKDTVDARGALLQVLGTPTSFVSRHAAHGDVVSAIAHSDVANLVATGDLGGIVVLWDIDQSGQGGAVARDGVINTGDEVNSLVFGPSGDELMIATLEDGAHIWDLTSEPPVRTDVVAEDGVNLVASEDGTHVVGVAVSESGEALLALFDTTTDEEVAAAFLPLTIDEYVMAEPPKPAISHDMSRIALPYRDLVYIWRPAEPGAVEVLDVNTLGLKTADSTSAFVTAIEFVGDSNQLAVAVQEGDIFLLDLDAQGGESAIRASPAPTNEALALSSSTIEVDGVLTDVLASAQFNGVVKLWTVADGALVEAASLLGHDEEARAVGFTNNGGLVSGAWDGDVIWWRVSPDTRFGTPLLAAVSDTTHDTDVADVEFVRDDLIATLDLAGTVRWWDPVERVQVDGPVDDGVASVSSANGVSVFGGFDGSLTTIESPSSEPTELGAVRDGAAWMVELSDDGAMLLSVDDANAITIWDVATRAPVSSVGVPEGFEIGAVAFPASGRLWIGGQDTSPDEDGVSVAYEIDPATGEIISTFRHNDDEEGHQITSMAVSPDGSLLVTGGSDRRIFVWDTADLSAAKAEWAGHRDLVTSLAFLNDEVLIAADLEGRVLMWDVSSGRSVGEFTGPVDGVNVLDLSPSGTLLVAGGEDDIARIWDMQIAVWIDRVCDIAGRNMNQQEWERFRLGGEPVNHCEQSAAEDRPLAVYPV